MATILEEEVRRTTVLKKYKIEHENEVYTVYHSKVSDNELDEYDSEYDIFDSKGDEVFGDEVEEALIKLIEEN